MNIKGITGVHFDLDSITLSKSDGKDWQMLKAIVLGAIMDHFQSGRPMIEDIEASGEASTDAAADDHITQQIKELINTRVRPAVAQDGGDIVYKGFKDGIVYLHMQGACSGCPSSTATLKHGIENMLKYYVPEVTEVLAVE